MLAVSAIPLVHDRDALMERMERYIVRGYGGGGPGGEECWMWSGFVNPGGYGRVFVANKVSNGRRDAVLRNAHRVLYELSRGPIADNLTLDHLCRNRSCVNPAHLEPATNEENCLRGEAPTIASLRRGVCVNGHAGKVRGVPCRICKSAGDKAKRAAKPELYRENGRLAMRRWMSNPANRAKVNARRRARRRKVRAEIEGS